MSHLLEPLPLLILSTTILTSDGCYELCTISLEEAQQQVLQAPSVGSYVGHQNTAATISRLLGVAVECNRAKATQQVGQSAIIWRVKERLGEAQVVTDADLASLSATWKLLTRTA
jgi:Domain of unknown function (DUF1874)